MVKTKLSSQLERASKKVIDICRDKDFQSLHTYVFDDISWVGTGKHEVYLGWDKVMSFFLASQKNGDDSFRVVNQGYYCVQESVETALVIAILKVQTFENHMIEKMLRFSILWMAEDAQWKIKHVHSSVNEEELGEELDNSQEQQIIDYEQLKKFGGIDVVTHIQNMEGFVAHAHYLFEKYPDFQYVIVKFGIKNFRYINRHFGYAFGDKILESIASHLKEECHDYETCGRMEKDTFAMLCRYQDEKTFHQRIKRVKETLLDVQIETQLGFEVRYVGGIYMPQYKDHPESIKSMLDKALIAMRHVEKLQSNAYLFFEDHMLEEQEFYSSLVDKAPLAMQNQEFLLYLQPQFDIQTQALTGAEALTRWHHQGELIYPNQFIPAFEESDLIMQFDFYMLEKVCQTLRQWMDEGRTLLPISINQSRKHMKDDTYIKHFCEVVDQYQIPHEFLIFELTESAFVGENEKVKTITNQLHDEGYLIAIDDFGTGYASLNILSEISFDILKIDKSLIENLSDNKRTETLVKKVIELAHSMETKVVCEGIETIEQLQMLQALGCDIGQGYLMGRPIEKDVFQATWMDKKQL